MSSATEDPFQLASLLPGLLISKRLQTASCVSDVQTASVSSPPADSLAGSKDSFCLAEAGLGPGRTWAHGETDAKKIAHIS